MPEILHHIEIGPPEAPALVLLHGFLGRGQDWSEVEERLSSDFRCIMIDLPGHGRSVDLAPSAYEWEGAVAAVGATLDRLDVERCSLVGYSMGGRLALGFALAHRRRVGRLVLVGASPGIREEAARRERIDLDEARAGAIMGDFEAFLQSWYEMPLFESIRGNGGLLHELAGSRNGLSPRSRRHNEPAELAFALRGLSTGRMPSYWDHLDDIGAPTLAVAGERDPKFADIAFRMAGAGRPVIPLILPATGHLVPLERPDQLARTVRDFCRDALLKRTAPVQMSHAA